MFPVDSDDYEHLRDIMVKLSLNDSSFSYEPEVSPALVTVLDAVSWACFIWRLLETDLI